MKSPNVVPPLPAHVPGPIVRLNDTVSQSSLAMTRPGSADATSGIVSATAAATAASAMTRSTLLTGLSFRAFPFAPYLGRYDGSAPPDCWALQPRKATSSQRPSRGRHDDPLRQPDADAPAVARPSTPVVASTRR